MFGSSPSPPPPPPPPPAAPMLANPSIAQGASQERSRLASAAGEGFTGTDVTGGQGAAAPQTTAGAPKNLLGG